MSRLPRGVDRLSVVSGLEVRRARRWAPRRRHRFASLVVLLVVLVVLGTDVYLLSERNVTTRVSFGTALRGFRDRRAFISPGQPDSSVSTGATASVGTTGSTAVTDPSAAPATSSNAVPPAVLTPIASAAPSAAVVSAPAPFTPPPEGVYRYRTTGGEQVSILGASHKFPAETYSTVRRTSGCQWTVEFDVLREHVEHRAHCSQIGSLLQLDQSRAVSFFGVTEASDYTFTPPQLMVSVGEPAGTTRDSYCSGSMGSAQVKVTDLGHETVMVGGVSVDVVRVVADAVLSGKARGKAHDDQLLDATTGLVVSWSGWVDSYADTSFGTNVHYTEHGSFLLESMTPST